MSETENERIARIVDERLEEVLMGRSVPAPQSADQYGQGFDVQPSMDEVLRQVLNDVDPTDSESALVLFEWLKKNARLLRAGTLDLGGLSGYLFMYQEPKGATREGWTAGGTTGDRIVEESLKRAEESGVQATERGLCPKCYSAVRREPDSSEIVLEVADGDLNPAICSAGGEHELRVGRNRTPSPQTD